MSEGGWELALRNWLTRYARREPRTMFATGLVLTVLLLCDYLWCIRTQTGQQFDENLLGRAQSFNAVLAPPAALLRLGGPVLGALAVAVLGIAAIRRGAWSETSTAAVVIATSVALSSLLKATLDRPFLGILGYQQNTFPSGHVTAAAALAVGVVLLWPRPLSVFVLVAGAAVCVAASLASIIGFAHRPSDVIGSLLLVLLVTTAVLALAGRSRARPVPAGATPGNRPA